MSPNEGNVGVDRSRPRPSLKAAALAIIGAKAMEQDAMMRKQIFGKSTSTEIKVVKRGILLPENFLYLWGWIEGTSSVLMIFTEPYNIAFGYGSTSRSQTFTQIYQNTVYALDIIFCFFTPTTNPRNHHQKLVTNKEIAGAYLSGWFTLDFVASTLGIVSAVFDATGNPLGRPLRPF